MKHLILLSTLIISAYSYSCSCEQRDFTTPYSGTMIKKLIERVFNAKVGDIELVKYYPSVFERVFSPKPEARTGGNCWGNGPENAPMHYCQLKSKAKYKVDIPELGCYAIVKAKRNSRISRAKLITHTCKL